MDRVQRAWISHATSLTDEPGLKAHTILLRAQPVQGHSAVPSCAGANGRQPVRDSFDARGSAAGDGGDDHDAVAVLEAVGFAAEKADVFLVDIDVDELADAAGVVAEMASHPGEFLLELGQ